MTYDIIVIGGGASGMAAAISAAKDDKDVKIAVLERMNRMGKKLALTGNGRCNITNKDLSLSHFHGENVEFAAFALSEIDLDYTIGFFEEIGVPIFFDERGRGYPRSLQAGSVLDAMRFKMSDLGVDVHYNCAVTDIKKGFSLTCENGKMFNAKKVIIASGGAAAPKTGSDGSGVKLLKTLGHTANTQHPAIVQLKTDNTYTKQLKGIKIDAAVALYIGEKIVKSTFGEVLFTDYGLSGPPILELSRTALQSKNALLSVDIMSEIGEEKLHEDIIARAKTLQNRELSEFFTGMINKRVGQIIIKSCGLSLQDTAASLNEKHTKMLARRIKYFHFNVLGDTGFANAQTTAGGVKTTEFCDKTFQSNKTRGLYATGEVLDIDGDCGGYNLQWAWSSGILAGRAAIGK